MIFLEVLRFISGDAGLEQHQAFIAVLSVPNLANLLAACQELFGGSVEAAGHPRAASVCLAGTEQ